MRWAPVVSAANGRRGNPKMFTEFAKNCAYREACSTPRQASLDPCILRARCSC
jgi:hypothetical protein